MENTKLRLLIAGAAMMPFFIFSASAQERTDFGLDRAGTLESLQAFTGGPVLPDPVARPVTDQPAGLTQEEFDSYLEEGENAGDLYAKSAPVPASSVPRGDGVVKLYQERNKETLEIRYRDENGSYIPEALASIRHFFRCRLTGLEKEIPASLLEIIDALQEKFGDRTVILLCGYRSPRLNASLAAASGGAARNSLHMQGLAADIRIDGVKTSALRDAAKKLKAGGVGYYPDKGFVHIDAGSIRYW